MSEIHQPITEECRAANCPKIVEHDGQQVCATYIRPQYWWDRGGCPIAYRVQELTPQQRHMTQKRSEKKQRGGLHLRKYKHTREGSKHRYIEKVEG